MLLPENMLLRRAGLTASAGLSCLLLEYSLISISGCKFPNCSFNNSENAPIHLLFSNLVCGLALDRRASLQLGQRRTKVKALIKYRLKITLVRGPDHSGRPRYADPPPLIRHWQLVLKYFRY